MKFIGATRKQVGKDINDDAFAVFDGMFAFLMDGAGDARGAAQRCIETIKSYQPQMPSFNQLVTLLNMTYGAESTLLAIKVEDNFLSGVSCGDSPLLVIREGQLLRVNKNTKPRLGTSRPDIYRIALSLKRHDVIIAASDGFVLDGDKLVDTVGQHISKPGELSEALLEAQTYCGDDVTVITRVI